MALWIWIFQKRSYHGKTSNLTTQLSATVNTVCSQYQDALREKKQQAFTMFMKSRVNSKSKDVSKKKVSHSNFFTF